MRRKDDLASSPTSLILYTRKVEPGVQNHTSDVTQLPSLLLKARHLGGFAFSKLCRFGVHEQALGGTTLGFGIMKV